MLQGQREVKDQQIERQAQNITRLTDALAAVQQTVAAAQTLHARRIKKQLLIGEAGKDQQSQESEPRNKYGWFSMFYRKNKINQKNHNLSSSFIVSNN